MQRAGRTVFQQLLVNWPEVSTILVLCGSGNNGGDGYVVGSLALEAGLEVRLCPVLGAPKPGTDAALAADAFLQAGGQLCEFSTEYIPSANLIVDAMLGTGLNSTLRAELHNIVKQVNESGRPVLAIDLPTGVNADTGGLMGAAIRADATVTFIAMKLGLMTGEGKACAGAVTFADLGVPTSIYSQVAYEARVIPDSLVKQCLIPRSLNCHKGDFGHLLVIGGAPGMGGAPRLTAEAALRVGAGRVTVATDPKHAAMLHASRPEIMVRGVASEADLQPLLAQTDVIAIGPGLGQDNWAQMLWQVCVARDVVKVVDADALNLLANAPIQYSNWVLTPHPGEAARLLKVSGNEIQNDRCVAAQAIQRKYGGEVILKGAGSVVAGANEDVWICAQGNPGMATAGMGDLLTGVIGGLLCQGLPSSQATKLAVWLHASAADRAAVAGERGLIAGDLFPHLRKLVNPR